MPPGRTSKKTSESEGDVILADPIAEVDETTVPTTTPKRTTGEKRRRSDRTKRRTIALPVLIVDETVLLPHMSIPFPIEDDETAMVVDRASRTQLRQVLVLTERQVNRTSSDSAIDADFRELLSDAVAEPTPTRRKSRNGTEGRSEDGDDPGGWGAG